jgi:hypothetical protein
LWYRSWCANTKEWRSSSEIAIRFIVHLALKPEAWQNRSPFPWPCFGGGFLKRLHFIVPLVAFSLCAGRFFLLSYRYAVNVFVGDQWYFNEATVFHRASLLEMFRWQHGPHRQGLGGLLHGLLDPWFHWNSRMESFVAAGIIVLACALALWLKYRIAGKLQVSDAIIPLLFLTPVQYEVTIGVTNYAHGPLPLLLVVTLCLAWTLTESWLRWSLILLFNFLAVYTGFGLVLGVITPLAIVLEYFAQRRDVRGHLTAFIIALLSLASFFLGYYRNVAVECSSQVHSAVHYFLFSGFMFANFAGVRATRELVPAILLGSALVVGFTLSLFVILKKRQMVPLILLSYSLAFALATAYGRTCMGLGAAEGSRYMTYLIPAFFAVYLFALSWNGIPRMATLAAVSLLALLSGFSIHSADAAAMAHLHDGRSQWKACYLAQHDLLNCNRLTHATIYSYPDTLQNKLEFLEREHLNLYAQ